MREAKYFLLFLVSYLKRKRTRQSGAGSKDLEEVDEGGFCQKLIWKLFQTTFASNEPPRPVFICSVCLTFPFFLVIFSLSLSVF